MLMATDYLFREQCDPSRLLELILKQKSSPQKSLKLPVLLRLKLHGSYIDKREHSNIRRF